MNSTRVISHNQNVVESVAPMTTLIETMILWSLAAKDTTKISYRIVYKIKFKRARPH